MRKLCWWGASTTFTVMLGVIIAKAQSLPSGWSWIITSPHVIPALVALTVICLVIAIGQYNGPGRFYWKLFSWFFRQEATAAVHAAASTIERAFIVHNSHWGNAHRSESIDDVLNALPLNAVAFHLSPDTFRPYTTSDKADPAPGPGKFLDVSCSFPGQAARTIRRKEGDIVVLPPDQSLYEQIEQLKAEMIGPVKYKFLTLDKAWYNPSVYGSTDTHKDKVRFTVKNGGSEAEVWSPLWESPDVVAQTPFGAKLQKEGPKGHLAGDWESETLCVSLKPGQVFTGWIGLLQSHGQGLAVRTQQGNTGTLIFPLKIQGKLTYERIQI